MRKELQARRWFLVLWASLLVLKLVLAAQLPLFVDEAFYWQEGQHLAWAYSDLPGLTAWLTRIGVALGGNTPLALRAPFLLLAACLPWLVARIAAREFDPALGWQAGIFAMLLPLAGTLGLLAVPDVAMALATLLCMDAGTRLLRNVSATAALELAAGLAIGALSHYRFIAVIAVGGVALLLIPEGRRALRDPRVWVAIAFGIAAWTPLLAWNMDNAEAGLRFQLIDRHPWAFHGDGVWFVLVQALLVTPLLFAALMLAAWRHRRDDNLVARYFAWLGALVVLGFFVLGFFADTERVSFHWPLPGYVALLPLLPGVLQRWPAWLRRATAALAALGLVALLGYYAAVSVPSLRAQTAGAKWYPGNFAGWDPLARAVRGMRATMPARTRIVADNFKVGAELGFALGDPDIAVLPHPLNRKHGRAPQLALWGLRADERAALGRRPLLLVVGASEVEYKNLLAHYHDLCQRLGPLPPPRVVNVDHGSQRFLLFRLPPRKRPGPCTTPAMAWFDAPAAGARVGRSFLVVGWAFKDGVGIDRVEVTLDGRPLVQARYGGRRDYVAPFWRISTDPAHPDVGFEVEVTLSRGSHGTHWLGLVLHGKDGSREAWPQQRIEVDGIRD
ncbi:glycosyltransferase family 39 protein [Luteimonas sp. 50]|uniref:Glycosyltransferase family 39 protein n=1 Tax=Cognatiluteimonas sedimenti TaxID=2927791 RepID=A0ABT0A061_9GAMM|nr:glycosyltransferase family 39 protein [Lysobacter sedimenti]MCJ0824359.1 glycosyltransferase family 39 protein [Lysobacter sedimenti]